MYSLPSVDHLTSEMYQLAGAIAIAWLAWRLWGVLFHPLRHVPGPFHTRVTGAWISWATVTGERTSYVHALHQKYGPVVRISPREVSITDMKAVRDVFAQSTKCFKDPAYYTTMQIDPAHPGVFSMSRKDQHTRRRQLLSPSFSKSSIVRFEPLIRDKLDFLVDKLRQKAGESIDILVMWRLFTADVTVYASFGSDLKMTESAETHPFIKDIDTALMMSVVEGAVGSVAYNAVKKVAQAVFAESNSFRRAFFASYRALQSFGHPLVKDYVDSVEHDSASKDIVPRLMGGMQAKEDPLSMGDVVAEAINMIIAGTDTTSTTLTYLCFEVFSRPAYLSKVQDEIGQAFAEHSGAPPSTVLEKLPYTKRAILETLRLHSAAPSSLPRITPDGLMANDIFLPPGTCVGMQPHSIHRETSIWGKDCEDWKPERWISPTPEQEDAQRPFSSGTTNCLGQTLAYLELAMAASYIFHNFTAELAPGFTPADMEHKAFFLLVPRGHACRMIFTPIHHPYSHA